MTYYYRLIHTSEGYHYEHWTSDGWSAWPDTTPVRATQAEAEADLIDATKDGNRCPANPPSATSPTVPTTTIDRVTVYWAEDGDAKGWCFAAWSGDEHDGNGEFSAADGEWWNDQDAEDEALARAEERWPAASISLGNPDYAV